MFNITSIDTIDHDYLGISLRCYEISDLPRPKLLTSTVQRHADPNVPFNHQAFKGSSTTPVGDHAAFLPRVQRTSAAALSISQFGEAAIGG